MHPEVRQQGPGNCPFCGMALEPEMPSLEDDDNPELRDFSRRFWWTLPLTVVTLVLAMFGQYLPRVVLDDVQILPFSSHVQTWRSGELGVGKGCVRPCGSRWSASH